MTTLREAAQMALDALELHRQQYPHMVKGYCLDAIEALRAALAQPEQEPPKFPTMLRKMWSGGEVQQWINENWSAPPQREFIGLTDEEIDEAHETTMSFYGFAHAIESKLKENA